MTAAADIIGLFCPDAANALGMSIACAASNFGATRDSKAVELQYNNDGTDVPGAQVAQQQAGELFFGRTDTHAQPAAGSADCAAVAEKAPAPSFLTANGAAEAQAEYGHAGLAERAPDAGSSFWDDHVKRPFDLASGLATLIVLAPLMLVLTVLIFALDPGPVLFSQRRIGKGGKSFACYKFRSMTTNADKVLAEILARDPQARSEWECIQKLTNDPRITKFGKFLRVSSMDELPQLFNIIKGDMSLIGPRPIVESERIRYGRHFAAYSRVKPGLA